MNNNSWILSFLKYQIAAILATIIDFIVLILLTEIFHVWYVYSTAIGAFAGAFTNFNLCRYWAFTKSKNNYINQVYKYILVSVGSLILNTISVYLLTDIGNINYTFSKIIAAITIALFYNYTLQKYFVFKK